MQLAAAMLLLSTSRAAALRYAPHRCMAGAGAATARRAVSQRRAATMAANAGKTVTLKRGKARLFKRGNPLVYGGAVERTSGAPARGDVVDVLDGAGDRVGWGMYNPDSMCVRRADVSLMNRGAARGRVTWTIRGAKSRRRSGCICTETSRGDSAAATWRL